MNRGLANFVARLLSTKNRNLFIVRLGVNLTLSRFGIVGPLAWLISFPLQCVLGLLIEDGVFLIDVALDAYREGAKLEEFKRDAKAAYEKATAKIYEESEKEKIRAEYLRIISRVGTVGNGPR